MLHPRSPAMAVLLTALVAFGPLSTDMYLPALPLMTRDFAAPVSRVQLTLSVFLAGFALAQLAVGPLSDRFGRRPVLLGGLGLYVLASLACVFAPGVEALIGARFLQALGACTGSVLGRATVRDIHGPDQAARVLAYMGSAMALAPMLAPMAGGYLVGWFGWPSVFVFLTGFGAVLLGLVGLALPETNAQKDPWAADPKRMAGNYGTLLGHAGYRGYVGVIAFTFSGLFAFISGSSFVLMDVLGLAPQHFGLAFGSVVAGYALGSILAGRLTLRAGIDRMIRWGTRLSLAAALVLAALALGGVARVAAVVGPMALFMVGVGLVLPNAMAGAIGPFPRMAGAAAALSGFSQMAAAALTGWLVGLLHDGTARPMALVILATAAGAAGVYETLVRRKAP